MGRCEVSRSNRVEHRFLRTTRTSSRRGATSNRSELELAAFVIYEELCRLKGRIDCVEVQSLSVYMYSRTMLHSKLNSRIDGIIVSFDSALGV